MLLTDLDKTLCNILTNLVGLDFKIAIPPYPNNVGLGIHYYLAWRSQHPTKNNDIIKIQDWNSDCLDFIGSNIDKFVMFFTSKKQAEKILSKAAEVGSGIFCSLPITKFRPRYVFIEKSSDLAVKCHNKSKMSSHLIEEIIYSNRCINILTDMEAQASAFMECFDDNLIAKNSTYICCGKWPTDLFEKSMDKENFYLYGAPCTDYMSKQGNTFTPIEIDDEIILLHEAYETQIVWHVPGDTGIDINATNKTISTCLHNYHRTLFEAAIHEKNGKEFYNISTICSNIMSSHHPSFLAQIYANPNDFRRSLAEHHSAPCL